MHNRYTDFEELRPTGEVSHIPDDTLEDGCDGDPQRQRVATSTGGYPDVSSDAEAECQSCGASIPVGQTKCRCCLSNHLGNEAVSTDETATTLLGIVHMVVDSTTFYGAVAKGRAATKLYTATGTESADDFTLIYDLEEAPAPQLTDRWPSLPDAVHVNSPAGEQLLSAARDPTGWAGRGTSATDRQAPTQFYDECGHEIHDESRLSEVLDDADHAVWLVPAMALTDAAGEDESDSQRSSRPSVERLDCQNCGQATEHRFKAYESVPDETWSGQPIWGCQECGTARYGPALE
ncbi:biosurfactant protein 1 [Halococcoides cellulosivorans]|uniref:Uncharacterized protein n=1 Tax=Halococcoides cellulosivorans TaxID=1679096 RepID=A0A2R4X3Q5_9EURY|nr:hypothetical protein [Halococcoides cellulosivorans]AWB28419.1 hypothetical protein HARCEL1_12255 [Halococcoides cellulosivorans]